MKPTDTLTRVTLWLERLIALLLLGLVPGMPALLNWYCTVRTLTQPEYMAVLIAFYICAVFAALALWDIDALLRRILAEKVFVRKNVSAIRRIRWHCAAISLVCLPAAFVYLPLCFVVVIMGFLSLIVSVMVQVMKAAVAIREENDLTI